MQDIALGFVELPKVPMGPCLQPVQASQDGILSLQHVECISQHGVVCRLDPTAHVADKHHSSWSPLGE